MNKQLYFLVDQISREKGVTKDVVLRAIEYAMVSAAKKNCGTECEIISKVDEENYDIKLFEVRHVVETVENPDTELTVKEAKKYLDQPAVGRSSGGLAEQPDVMAHIPHGAPHQRGLSGRALAGHRRRPGVPADPKELAGRRHLGHPGDRQRKPLHPHLPEPVSLAAGKRINGRHPVPLHHPGTRTTDQIRR